MFRFAVSKNNYLELVAELDFDEEASNAWEKGLSMSPNPQIIVLKTLCVLGE